jgi:integrase
MIWPSPATPNEDLPLSKHDPSRPRVGWVGVTLLALLRAGVTTGAGDQAAPKPLPPEVVRAWEKAGALAKYLEQKDDLHAGRKPRVNTDGLTMKDLVNSFLHEKNALVESGELSPRTWADYKLAGDLLVSEFDRQRVVTDLGPDDFAPLRKKMARKGGPHLLGKTIQCIRCVFRYGYECGLLDKPVRYGLGFKRPSKKTLRLHKAKQGPKLFENEELRRMIDSAGVQLKAMILLGINCGFGNSDVGNLPLTALDLENGWINYPRPKTGIDRRAPLWPETIVAIREALAKRPEPKSEKDAALVFVTKYGQSWAKDIADSPITKETRKLLDTLGIGGHGNHYTMRHTFRTVGDESKDQPAVDYIMGHEVPHMSSVYREVISGERLKAVADHVHGWLFRKSAPEKSNTTNPAKKGIQEE